MSNSHFPTFCCCLSRSQESLVSAADEVISSQPFVTDPNEAWGEEPAKHRSIPSRDPFGDVVEDASLAPFEDAHSPDKPFLNGADPFATINSSGKDPFE